LYNTNIYIVTTLINYMGKKDKSEVKEEEVETKTTAKPTPKKEE
jgi:hypothetical protein